MQQGTLNKSIFFTGVGLHSGRLVKLEVHPASVNTGIWFERSDAPKAVAIHANPFNVTSTTLNTTLGADDHRVSTIEHLMAAFYALGVDNALVRLNALEIPILDGSSAPFVDKINEVGVCLQDAKRRIFRLSQSIEVVNADQYIRYDPPVSSANKPELKIDCSIDYSQSSAIGKQEFETTLSKEVFMGLCEARTFCHIEDVNRMREGGFALGGSLDNAVVVNDTKVLNNEGLRFADEFVKHKTLDCIGDLALLGGFLDGKVTVHKGGHTLHVAFVRKLHEALSRASNSPTFERPFEAAG